MLWPGTKERISILPEFPEYVRSELTFGRRTLAQRPTSTVPPGEMAERARAPFSWRNMIPGQHIRVIWTRWSPSQQVQMCISPGVKVMGIAQSRVGSEERLVCITGQALGQELFLYVCKQHGDYLTTLQHALQCW